jgi:hypothetical protein
VRSRADRHCLGLEQELRFTSRPRPQRQVAILAALVVTVSLAGCGSKSYADSIHPGISAARGAIESYDASQPSGLSATGAACEKAYLRLARNHDLLTTTVPSSYKREADALKRSYLQARQGFESCARGARTMDFPLMTQAERQIAQANGALEQARRLDH